MAPIEARCDSAIRCSPLVLGLIAACACAVVVLAGMTIASFECCQCSKIFKHGFSVVWGRLCRVFTGIPKVDYSPHPRFALDVPEPRATYCPRHMPRHVWSRELQPGSDGFELGPLPPAMAHTRSQSGEFWDYGYAFGTLGHPLQNTPENVLSAWDSDATTLVNNAGGVNGPDIVFDPREDSSGVRSPFVPYPLTYTPVGTGNPWEWVWEDELVIPPHAPSQMVTARRLGRVSMELTPRPSHDAYALQAAEDDAWIAAYAHPTVSKVARPDEVPPARPQGPRERCLTDQERRRSAEQTERGQQAQQAEKDESKTGSSHSVM